MIIDECSSDLIRGYFCSRVRRFHRVQLKLDYYYYYYYYYYCYYYYYYYYYYQYYK